MKSTSKNIFDLIVVGGGPAGMMAAGRAAELGKRVLLLEKNEKLGKKLLTTGGGRCNVTNNKTNIRVLAEKYKSSDKFLFSAFSQFAVEETLNFFHSRGMQTKEENEGRLFPISDKAESVWNVLIDYMKEGNVEVLCDAVVSAILYDDKTKLFTIKLRDKRSFESRSCVIATGGISHPETGSTGQGFTWLKKLGHTIVENDFALVPLSLKDTWAKKLSGLTLENISLSAYQKNKKQFSSKGKLLFTHFGVSGPTVINMSKAIGDLLPYGEVILELDLFPDSDHVALKLVIQDLLIGDSNKMIKNTLPAILPLSLVAPVLDLCKISGETYNHSVSRESRQILIQRLKSIPLRVKGLLGAEKAIVSSGGVELKEVNFKSMESRKIPGLYMVGDVLNIERPSGGYSLQLCWTTGFVAGDDVGQRQ